MNYTKGGTSSKSIFKGTDKETHEGEKKRRSDEHRQVFRGYSSSPSAQP